MDKKTIKYLSKLSGYPLSEVDLEIAEEKKAKGEFYEGDKDIERKVVQSIYSRIQVLLSKKLGEQEYDQYGEIVQYDGRNDIDIFSPEAQQIISANQAEFKKALTHTVGIDEALTGLKSGPLKPMQKQFIDNFFKSKGNWGLAFRTGIGKTRTFLEVTKKYLNETPNKIVLISTPLGNLVSQMKKEIAAFDTLSPIVHEIADVRKKIITTADLSDEEYERAAIKYEDKDQLEFDQKLIEEYGNMGRLVIATPQKIEAMLEKGLIDPSMVGLYIIDEGGIGTKAKTGQYSSFKVHDILMRSDGTFRTICADATPTEFEEFSVKFGINKWDFGEDERFSNLHKNRMAVVELNEKQTEIAHQFLDTLKASFLDFNKTLDDEIWQGIPELQFENLAYSDSVQPHLTINQFERLKDIFNSARKEIKNKHLKAKINNSYKALLAYYKTQLIYEALINQSYEVAYGRVYKYLRQATISHYFDNHEKSDLIGELKAKKTLNSWLEMTAIEKSVFSYKMMDLKLIAKIFGINGDPVKRQSAFNALLNEVYGSKLKAEIVTHFGLDPKEFIELNQLQKAKFEVEGLDLDQLAKLFGVLGKPSKSRWSMVKLAVEIFGNTAVHQYIEEQEKQKLEKYVNNRKKRLRQKNNRQKQALPGKFEVEIARKVLRLKQGEHPYASPLAHQALNLKKTVKNGQVEHQKVTKVGEILQKIMSSNLADQQRKKVIVMCDNLSTVNYLNYIANSKWGIKSSIIHGSATSKVKNAARQRYVFRELEKDRIDVVFATSVAERGLDLPNIDTVICYSPSKNVISEYQAIGRMRQGGTMITLCSPGEEFKAFKNNAERREFQEIRKEYIEKQKQELELRDEIGLLKSKFAGKQKNRFFVKEIKEQAPVAVNNLVSERFTLSIFTKPRSSRRKLPSGQMSRPSHTIKAMLYDKSGYIICYYSFSSRKAAYDAYDMLWKLKGKPVIFNGEFKISSNTGEVYLSARDNPHHFEQGIIPCPEEDSDPSALKSNQFATGPYDALPPKILQEYFDNNPDRIPAEPEKTHLHPEVQSHLVQNAKTKPLPGRQTFKKSKKSKYQIREEGGQSTFGDYMDR
ncbi:DEAD/DEAH box helicase [Candidatus Peregrinibacteria bacterium]|nr:DEAD/DEAH box helicase [Candidatus Peregrinibacteria bacterium]